MKTIRGPKKVLDTWLEALRSGKYKQAKGTLYDPDLDSYCCLGVLEHVCDGVVEVWPDGSFLSAPSNEWLERHGLKFYVIDRNSPDRELRPFANPSVSKEMTAAELNDSGDYDFLAIADLIEQNMEYTDA